MAEKYYILKIDEVREAFPADIRLMIDGLSLTDAVVLRSRDRFATAALQAYFDTVSNTIEVLEELKVTIPKELETLRDKFFEFAERAREAGRKIPD